jgi:DNA topoisomerase-1
MELSVNVGRFGPYIKLGEQFISIPKGEDLHEMELERAIQLIAEKQLADAPIGFYMELPVTKGKGRFGPFIKWNDMYINIPRAYNFDALSQNDINELIEKKSPKKRTVSSGNGRQKRSLSRMEDGDHLFVSTKKC